MLPRADMTPGEGFSPALTATTTPKMTLSYSGLYFSLTHSHTANALPCPTSTGNRAIGTAPVFAPVPRGTIPRRGPVPPLPSLRASDMSTAFGGDLREPDSSLRPPISRVVTYSCTLSGTQRNSARSRVPCSASVTSRLVTHDSCALFLKAPRNPSMNSIVKLVIASEPAFSI